MHNPRGFPHPIPPGTVRITAGTRPPPTPNGWRLRRLTAVSTLPALWVTWDATRAAVVVTANAAEGGLRRHLRNAGYHAVAVTPAGHLWARPTRGDHQ